MEGGGWRVEGGGCRVEGGGWRVEGGGFRSENVGERKRVLWFRFFIAGFTPHASSSRVESVESVEARCVGCKVEETARCAQSEVEETGLLGARRVFRF